MADAFISHSPRLTWRRAGHYFECEAPARDVERGRREIASEGGRVSGATGRSVYGAESGPGTAVAAERRGPPSGRCALLGRQHHHFGADLDTVVEVDHVVVDHADAARCRTAADAPRRVGAMNAIEGAAEIHRPRSEGI